MLDLALKASEDHPLEKLVQRAEESDRPVALWAFWIFSWLQQCDYFCFPPCVWNLLLFKVNTVAETLCISVADAIRYCRDIEGFTDPFSGFL